MRIIFTLLICMGAVLGAMSQEHHTRVVSHDNVFIFTKPSAGVNSFKDWAVFPDEKQEVRRVYMNVTLAYPENNAIAHWDYMDRIKIARKGGVKGKNIDYEIGRMLTPYGSNFKKGWNYTWKIDVTDFEAFLRDSVEIEYVHSGYEAIDTGWDLSVAFDFEFGPSIAKFITVDKLWNGNFQYGNDEKNIEESLKARKIRKAKGSVFGRFRIQHTGHGMDQPSGCSEFCSRWREVVFDGKVIDHRDMWKDCGDNPLYPQGGTWIFDRAYWCPGDLQVPDVIDVPLTKGRHTIDLDMEPFTANNINQPKEQITSYFFQFSEPHHNLDVAIEEIIAPNNDERFNRFNPIGFSPRIKIRNLGKENLHSLDIIYGTEGSKELIYKWEGDLAFYEAALISLPGEVTSKPGVNTFAVTLSDPNGGEDQWDGDNTMKSEFFDIPTLPTNFVVDFLTNNKPEENNLFIVNSRNDTVYMRSSNELEASTQYSDTLKLSEGKYFMMLTDTVGDGLEFWFQPESGVGHLHLKDVTGNFIKLLESDCGNGQFYSFRCVDGALVDTSVQHFSVNLFPRMAKDSLTINTISNTTSTLKIRITKDGKFIEQHEYANIKDASIGLDIKHYEKGRYVMEVYFNRKNIVNRRFNRL